MINGKSIMLWNVPAIFDGDPDAIARLLNEVKFEGVAIKGGDGSGIFRQSRYGPWPNWGDNISSELVSTLRIYNQKVYVWHFVYGSDPQGELQVAIELCDRFRPDGYIWNVETAFDRKPNAVTNARILSQGLLEAAPQVSQGLCWWALPESPVSGTEWHPKKVARAFLETVHVGMPMMYWQRKGATAAVNYLHNSLRIWRKMTDKPIVPIGRCYDGTGGYTNADGILGFGNEVYRLAAMENLIGNSWYSLDKAIKKVTWLSALQDLPTWDNLPVDLTLEEKVERLVRAHPDLFPELSI